MAKYFMITGIVAVSCVHNYDCDERIELYSKLLLQHSLILIWSFVDPIHPQVINLWLYIYVYKHTTDLDTCVYLVPSYLGYMLE